MGSSRYRGTKGDEDKNCNYARRLALSTLSGSAYAAPVTPPGEEAGLNAAHPVPEGVYFVNIFGTGGDYVVDDKRSNLTFDVPVIFWATPWQLNFLGFTGRFEVIAAAPIIGNWGLLAALPTRACGANYTCRDFTAMYNPLLIGWLCLGFRRRLGLFELQRRLRPS